ncbi:MAG: hypothetical protein GY838_12085 [bacterium]|nr:hypothetical protein [bacterium]
MQRLSTPSAALLAVTAISLLFLGSCGEDDPAEPREDPCAIAFTYPDPGTMHLSGESVNLRWHAAGGGRVRVALLRAGSEQGEIIAGTDNDGYYQWTATTMGGPSADDYAVTVASLDEAACADTLGPLRLVDVSNCGIDPAIRATEVAEGDDLLIQWTSGNTSGTVDIDLFYGPLEGDLIAPLAGGTPDDGEYLWENVDSFHHGTGDLYYVRIGDARVPTCFGTNAIPFTIVDEDVCVIDVRTPPAYSTYDEGDVLEIEFSSQRSSGSLDFRLYAGSSTPLDFIALRVPVSETSVTWRITVDDDYTGPDNMYRVLVYDTEDSYCRGFSPQFSITRTP